MPDPFDSPRRTLRRAKQHIEELQFRSIAFKRERKWTFVSEEHQRRRRCMIKFDRSFFNEAPSLAADAVGNLRDALDQIGHSVALAAGLKGLSHKSRTKFPMCSKEEELPRRIKNACSDLPDSIQNVFASFKPYERGNALLWGVNKLANTKKHAMLTPVQPGGQSGFSLQVGGLQLSLFFHWNAEEYAIELRDAPAGLRLGHDVDLVFELAFKELGSYSGAEAADVLALMAGEVQRVRFAAELECLRLGFEV